MIKVQDIRQKFIDIKGQVERRVNDPYLLKYIETPIIDEDKLIILVSIMDRLELSYSKMQNFALAVMLIQIALDTHEHVSNSSENEKRRQLTVLSGDYFSGLYYKLLADSEDHLMIRALSKGVKEVNVHKVAVYQKECDGIEKLMTSIKMIESSLLLNVSEYFKVDLWNEFISHLLLFKRLLYEKSQFVHTESSIFFDALRKIVFPKNDIKVKNVSTEQQDYLLMICDRYIEFSKQFIETGINQIPYLNELLELRITSILNQHQPIAKTFVEEG